MHDTEILDDDGRFSRFELISWWDQERLRRAKILVVGAGAIGNEVIKNCALLGIGNILVADLDHVENSNLSRSVLFRAADNGALKAEVACTAARGIYPDLKIQPFCSNIVHDLGLGVYLWADVIIGALDNREARVALNTGAAFARKPWVDGAIEVLNGVARVFVPHDGTCYECTMSETDWKMLETRRSCALLTREGMLEGRVPTTPTTGSIVAAVQVQETVKLLHGMDAMVGKGFVYNGSTGESYQVTYPRKADCFGHDSYERLESLGCGVGDMTASELLARARADLGADAVVGLSRDLVAGLECPTCATSEPVYRSLGQVTEKEGRCPGCGQMRAPVTLLTLGLEDDVPDMTLAEMGVPRLDVVTARSGSGTVSYVFDGDASAVLGDLPWP